MKIPRSDRKKARIEMIPLIDVTFQLLSFFIYVSLFMALQRGIPLKLPQADTAVQERAQALEVSLDARGAVFLEGEQVSLELLGEKLQAMASSRDTDRVILRGDRTVNYERIMEVLDKIRSSGLSKVSLEAQPRGGR